jgi:lipoic acid synthetase
MSEKAKFKRFLRPFKKQKSAEKTSRIPIKIVPVEQVLKSPIGYA